MNKHILFIITILIITSCSNTNEYYKSKYIFTNTSNKVLIHKIEGKYYNTNSISWKDSKLIMSNRIDNSLYEFSKDRLLNKYIFDIDGNNGVGSNVSNFNYQSKDSIFILGFYSKKLFIVNSKGNINMTIPLLNYSEEVFGNPFIVTESPLHYNKGEIQFSTFAKYPIIENIETYRDRPIYYKFDLKDSTFFKSPITFNISRIKNNYNPDSYTALSTKFKDGYLYMFQYDNIILHIKNDSLVNKYEVESEHFQNIMHVAKPDWQKASEAYFKGSNVFGVRYDKYQKLIYVLLHLPIDKEKFNRKKRYSFNDKDIAVIVLNDKFEKLAETILPIENYQRNMFINKEGLWVSNNNPNNPDFDESKLSFTLFKLEKKK